MRYDCRSCGAPWKPACDYCGRVNQEQPKYALPTGRCYDASFGLQNTQMAQSSHALNAQIQNSCGIGGIPSGFMGLLGIR